ncbi:unnamed protein product, partial [Ectocarpus fasciculatus]
LRAAALCWRSGVKFASFPTPTEATGRRCFPSSLRAHILDATAVSSPSPCKTCNPPRKVLGSVRRRVRISDVSSCRGSRAESRKYEIGGCRPWSVPTGVLENKLSTPTCKAIFKPW